VTDPLAVEISGATGICGGVLVLELAGKTGTVTHLVVTPTGHRRATASRVTAGLRARLISVRRLCGRSARRYCLAFISRRSRRRAGSRPLGCSNSAFDSFSRSALVFLPAQLKIPDKRRSGGVSVQWRQQVKRSCIPGIESITASQKQECPQQFDHSATVCKVLLVRIMTPVLG